MNGSAAIARQPCGQALRMQHWKAASCPAVHDTVQVLGQSQSICMATSLTTGRQAAVAWPTFHARLLPLAYPSPATTHSMDKCSVIVWDVLDLEPEVSDKNSETEQTDRLCTSVSNKVACMTNLQLSEMHHFELCTPLCTSANAADAIVRYYTAFSKPWQCCKRREVQKSVCDPYRSGCLIALCIRC